MENKKFNFSFNGGGFAGLLTIAFIVLKLTKVIDWAWIWVLAPLWISVGIVFSLVLIVFILALIGKLLSR